MSSELSSPSSNPDNGAEDRSDRYSYLPYLSLLLVLLMAGWFVKHYIIDRPSTGHELRVASFEQALRLIPQEYAGEISEEELYQAAMEAMVERLGGRFSTYLTAPQQKQLEIETQGSYGGIGAVLAREDGNLVVVEVKEGSPAARAGLQAEDRIVEVNGRDVRDLPLSRAVKHIRGEAGSSVELTLRRASSGETETVKVGRDTIDLEAVKGRMAESDDIAIVTIQRMGRDCAEKVREQVSALKQQGARALLLDLRDHPGGLMEQAVQTTDLFLDSGVIVSAEGSAGRGRGQESDARHRHPRGLAHGGAGKRPHGQRRRDYGRGAETPRPRHNRRHPHPGQRLCQPGLLAAGRVGSGPHRGSLPRRRRDKCGRQRNRTR